VVLQKNRRFYICVNYDPLVVRYIITLVRVSSFSYNILRCCVYPLLFFLLLFITEAIACLNGCYAFACSKIYGVGKVKFKTKWPGILNTYLVDKNKCIYTFARTVFNILNRNKTRGYQESTIAHLINLIYYYLINYLHII
jgi:hypothetical protein